MSSVEIFLNRSYPRFASTATTTTANVGVLWGEYISMQWRSGVFRGVDMERCPPPSWRQLIFSAFNNLYCENNGPFACKSSSKES